MLKNWEEKKKPTEHDFFFFNGQNIPIASPQIDKQP